MPRRLARAVRAPSRRPGCCPGILPLSVLACCSSRASRLCCIYNQNQARRSATSATSTCTRLGHDREDAVGPRLEQQGRKGALKRARRFQSLSPPGKSRVRRDRGCICIRPRGATHQPASASQGQKKLNITSDQLYRLHHGRSLNGERMSSARSTSRHPPPHPGACLTERRCTRAALAVEPVSCTTITQLCTVTASCSGRAPTRWRRWPTTRPFHSNSSSLRHRPRPSPHGRHRSSSRPCLPARRGRASPCPVRQLPRSRPCPRLHLRRRTRRSASAPTPRPLWGPAAAAVPRSRCRLAAEARVRLQPPRPRQRCGTRKWRAARRWKTTFPSASPTCGTSSLT